MKRYSYLPGMMLLIAAVVRAATHAGWARLDVGLVAVGGVGVMLSLVWNFRDVKEWFADPRGIFAVATGISTVLLVGCLALVNMLVWYRPTQVDLTTSGRNTVSAESREIVAKLSRDVVLRQFGRTRDPRVDQLLGSFAAASHRIQEAFVDADRDPVETRRYSVVRNGTVVVESGGTFRKVEELTEQAIVTAILQVTNPVQRTICFVTGHGEHGLADERAQGLTRLVTVLEASNFKTARISLLENEVPSRCSAIVVAGPQQDLVPAESDRLTTFAASAGGVAILIDPAPAPSLSAWLKPWGIAPSEGVIVDTSGAGQAVGGGPQTPLALGYGNHAITRGFEIATMYDLARPLDVLSSADYGGKPVALAQTGARSYEQIEGTGGRAREGPLTLAAATWIRRTSAPGLTAPPEVRVVAFGDSDFVTNALIGRQGNRDFFVRTVSWLAGEDEATIVRVEERENRRIDLTERTRAWMYAVNVGLLPLIPLLSGMIVFLRSKR